MRTPNSPSQESHVSADTILRLLHVKPVEQALWGELRKHLQEDM